jgi:hypothetical protein
MAFTLVQKAGNDNGAGAATTSIATAYTSDVTIGNLLIAVFGQGALGGGGFNVVTDTLGNNWTRAVLAPVPDGPMSIEIWFTIAVASGPNTVTFSQAPVTGFFELIVAEYAGIQNAQLDVVNFGLSADDVSVSTQPITTTKSNELIIVSGTASVDAPNWTMDSGFTPELTQSNNTNGSGFPSNLVFGDQIVNAIGTYSSTLTPDALPNHSLLLAAIAAFFQPVTVTGITNTIPPDPRPLPWRVGKPRKSDGKHIMLK